MTCTLLDPKVRAVLDGMHAEADHNDPPLLAKAEGKTGDERAALLTEAFIPVDPDAGRLLYALVRGAAPGLTVEFGTSFGISAIYMAAALKDRGGGQVITTEIVENKAAKAREYIDRAGLLDFIEIRLGDALATLNALPGEVSFVFLDGMKSLYVPVLKQLEPALKPGALVVADDLALFPGPLKPYMDYVRDPANGYVSVTLPIGDEMELSTRAI
jgi:predicted O-methyltransferase YrrM